MKLLLLLGSGILLALGITGSSASRPSRVRARAQAGHQVLVKAEVIPAGTYDGFTVTGFCVFGEGTMTINGDLTIADGAQLNDSLGHVRLGAHHWERQGRQRRGSRIG